MSIVVPGAGNAGAGDNQDLQMQSQTAGATGANDDAEDENEDTITLTQAELDALIKKRVTRAQKSEAKKYNALQQELAQLRATVAGGQGGAPNAQQQQSNGGVDVSALVAAELQRLGLAPNTQGAQQTQTKDVSKAVQRAIKSTVKSEALALGVDPNKLDIVTKLVDIDDIEVDDDGEFDEEDITRQLKKLSKKHPDFFKGVNKPPVKAGGLGGGSNQPVHETDVDAAFKAMLYQQ